MDWGGTERDGERETYTARSTALVRALLAAGVRVRVLVGEELDRRVASEVVRRVRSADPGAAVELPDVRSVEEAARALDGCHVLVAARYHNLVAALSEGVPVVATGYGHKQASLAAAYGAADRAHDRDAYDLDLVVAQVRGILADHAVESARVRATAAADRAAVRAQEDRVGRLLGLARAAGPRTGAARPAERGAPR
jgi:polysaccharide pyruvyl transferase WcaK-like protein